MKYIKDQENLNDKKSFIKIRFKCSIKNGKLQIKQELIKYYL